MHRLGVVSFLNSKPLIAGLDERDDVETIFEVPARLEQWLARDDVDAALIPVVDVLRSAGRYRVLSDSCIACDGETMTVRIFSQVPPDRVTTLHVDGDSHTSVALARVMWRELFGVDVAVETIDARREHVHNREAVLLIGDKVVNPERGSFAFEVDLGGAWRNATGCPFVFAVWACQASAYADPARRPQLDELAGLIEAARDRGVAHAREIAESLGPPMGWPVELAMRYLVKCLKFRLEPRFVEGAELFARHCRTLEIVPHDATIAWPDPLAVAAR